MKAHGILVLVLIIAVLIGGWWAIAFFRTPTAAQPITQVPPTVPEPIFTLPITVSHSFQNGTHFYSGTVVSKSACGIKSSGISLTGINPAHVTLILEASSGVCADVATTSQSTFSVSFKTSGEKTPILDKVTVNGGEVSHTLEHAN